jgi:glutamine synthetase
MFVSFAELLRFLKEHQMAALDLRFTDLQGVWHHLTLYANTVNETLLEGGIPFEGAAMPGWCTGKRSDLLLKPRVETAVVDPFTAQPTLVVACEVWDPRTQKPYARDPRSLAARAEAYLQSHGGHPGADQAFFGLKPAFFIFEDVRFECKSNEAFYAVDATELPTNHGRTYGEGNLGFRPGLPGGYLSVPPVDQLHDMREEMVAGLSQMGLTPEKHLHGGAVCQHQLGFRHDTLVKTADHLQLYKYVVRNVAFTYGKTVTFMPKPLADAQGSGMPVHQSLWKGGASLFAGEAYGGLSQMALYYIGGLMAHGKALHAFTNPTTNSYKRLLPGFKAPAALTYASQNRSAAIRIPYAATPQAQRIEARFPDPTANGYLALSAMLMAGLDGIRRKLDPGKALDMHLHEAEASSGTYPTCPASLDEALDALDQDRAFLKEGDVFTDDVIDAVLELKRQEALAVSTAVHPMEFKLYYNR